MITFTFYYKKQGKEDWEPCWMITKINNDEIPPNLVSLTTKDYHYCRGEWIRTPNWEFEFVPTAEGVHVCHLGCWFFLPKPERDISVGYYSAYLDTQSFGKIKLGYKEVGANYYTFTMEEWRGELKI